MKFKAIYNLNLILLTVGNRSSASAPLATRSPVTIIKTNKIKRPWLQCLEDNKINWQERAAEGSLSS